MLLDAQGKPIQNVKEIPCPNCARGPADRVPSGGFGQTWYVCKCGYEFKEFLCPSVLS